MWPSRDSTAPIQDGAPQSEQPVGDPAAGQRREVDARGVDADDRRRLAAIEAEAAVQQRGRHEEHQQRPQPVVREPLPHLREEQRRQAPRVAEEAAFTAQALQARRRLVGRYLPRGWLFKDVSILHDARWMRGHDRPERGCIALERAGEELPRIGGDGPIYRWPSRKSHAAGVDLPRSPLRVPPLQPFCRPLQATILPPHGLLRSHHRHNQRHGSDPRPRPPRRPR